jgi:myo-inositol-1(or 4)-monophosphatase
VPFADEAGTVLPDGEIWVVDPVDGAVQLLQGLPQWSVSITLVRGGRPVLAAPHSHALIAAEAGATVTDAAPRTRRARGRGAPADEARPRTRRARRKARTRERDQ